MFTQICPLEIPLASETKTDTFRILFSPINSFFIIVELF